jgi:hypothetical protein
MILEVVIDDQVYELNVPEQLIQQAGEFFDKMDSDMDQGWQMSRTWVQSPNRLERAQIVADKLLGALETDNHDLGRMMAAYLLARLPQLERIVLDLSGDMTEHVIQLREPLHS